MLKGKKAERKAWMAGFCLILLTLLATPVFAKTISLKGIGAVPILALIIGIIIVLLQLIPAAILFFSFVGTLSAMVFKGRMVTAEEVDEGTEAIAIPRYEPIRIEGE